ncbi:nicotinamidase [Haliangium sp.]|uniref:nicotinamidase n=1 Tax=Haliangium sp. TaxID=2663208 RepID=UPI003D0DA24C
MPEPLPLPAFFDPERAATWSYRPDHQALLEAAQRARREHGVSPAAGDRRRVHVLLIDVQKDFCFPEGSLYVGGRSGTGAVDDARRLAAFLYRNAAEITRVIATLDTHDAHQIFFSSFWLDPDDQPPPPHRVVHAEDIDRGRLRPNPTLAHWLGRDPRWLTLQARHYCAELESSGRYQLHLWPPHCILGSDGHTLAGIVHEARMYHAYLRDSPSQALIKGQNPLTENYSVFAPEVLSCHDGGVLDRRDIALLDELLDADALIVAGQASSHCVKSSIDDLALEIQRRNPSLARKVYVLVDCMSAVTVPDGKGGFAADFTAEAEATQARWADAGMNLVRAADPIASWPGWPG